MRQDLCHFNSSNALIIKVIRHVFGVGGNSLKIRTSAYLGTLWYLILSRAMATIRIFHLFQLPDIVNVDMGV